MNSRACPASLRFRRARRDGKCIRPCACIVLTDREPHQVRHNAFVRRGLAWPNGGSVPEKLLKSGHPNIRLSTFVHVLPPPVNSRHHHYRTMRCWWTFAARLGNEVYVEAPCLSNS
jgi:hypothetical protein